MYTLTKKLIIYFFIFFSIRQEGWGEEKNKDPIIPLQLEAEELELSQQAQSIHAKGNAVIKQGDIKINAHTLTAFYRNKSQGNAAAQKQASSQEVWRIEAQGNVIIHSKQQQAFAELAIYECDKESLILTGGDLKLIVNPHTTVTAEESLEYWKSKNLGIAKGNAKVTLEKGRKVMADRLMAYFTIDKSKKLKLSKVAADSHVIMEGAMEKITSDHGVFDADKEIIILSGHVMIQRGKNKIFGDQAEVNLRTGVSRLLGKPNQQVRAEIVPENKIKKHLLVKK